MILFYTRNNMKAQTMFTENTYGTMKSLCLVQVARNVLFDVSEEVYYFDINEWKPNFLKSFLNHAQLVYSIPYEHGYHFIWKI